MSLKRRQEATGHAAPHFGRALVAALGLLVLVAGPTPADESGLSFDIGPTRACLDAAGERDAVPLPADLGTAEDCIGRAASACIEGSPMGGTTIGSQFCLSRELEWWDARLNAAYRALMAAARRVDGENRESGFGNRPSVARALREMERAWIRWRDGRCDFEASLWGAGTGAAGTRLDCLMRLTGRQALYLESVSLD